MRCRWCRCDAPDDERGFCDRCTAFAARKGVEPADLIRTNLVPPHIADAPFAWIATQGPARATGAVD